MIIERCPLWERFIREQGDLNLEIARRRSQQGASFSGPLYRGQADAEWPLTTTLDRYLPAQCAVTDYYRAAHNAQHAVGAYTGRQWKLISPEDYKLFEQTRSTLSAQELPELAYLTYLRHHGFPSPLLDWTASIWVAAFFAFSAARPGTDSVAIYAYLGNDQPAPDRGSDLPNISRVGPYISSHRRHFLQQSQYTVCLERKNSKWIFAGHDEVIDTQTESKRDGIWKIVIPASEKVPALRHLQTMNITSLSLFDSEEALMETIAFKEFWQA